MLTHYLNRAIKDIEALIHHTKRDIDDIKVAKHNDVLERSHLKNQLIHSFEQHKKCLDNELQQALKGQETSSLETLLNEEQHALLAQMKLKLLELKTCNRAYAKYVVSITQFYNTLLETIFSQEKQGYKPTYPIPATFFRAKA